MVTDHPIHVSRDNYRGNDPKKRAKTNETNRIASLLECHINAMVAKQTSPIGQYLYYQIADETGIDIKIVQRLCMAIDGGHNGFTVVRPGLSYSDAMRLIDAGKAT